MEMSLDDDATVSDAARELLRLHPAISSDSSRLMIAVNEEYQEHEFPLSENDEVAFIPPVSGGCACSYSIANEPIPPVSAGPVKI